MRLALDANCFSGVVSKQHCQDVPRLAGGRNITCHLNMRHDGWERHPVISTNNGDSWFSSNDTNVWPEGSNCDFGTDLTFGPSAFVIVRSYIGSFEDKGLVTSGDGATWTNRSGLTGLQIQTIAFGNGTFVAAGPTGIYRAEVAPPVLLAERMAASSAIRRTIWSELGRYRLQSSSNFLSRGDVLSFTNKRPPYQFVEAIVGNLGARFYRVVSP
jgi:hypothetical protein